MSSTIPPEPEGPEADATRAALAELVAVVDRLRDPAGGCPWDLEQTHASLIPYLLEEAHEVADAIRHGDDRHLAEELGDLLLQVVLHARIAAETRRFDLAAVARGISAKLVRRHPHVFGDAEAGDSAAVRRSCSRTNSTVAEDMLPYCRSTAREWSSAFSGSSSCCCTWSRMAIPPGWTTQWLISSTWSLCGSRKRSIR